MADMQDPLIKVIGFKTTFERLPVKGGVLDDLLDDRGFKLDAKGRRIMEMQETDWVSYAPAHSPINTMNWERIRHLRVTDEMLGGEITEKLRSMNVRWNQIQPAYDAWKLGHEAPLYGTPLAAWPGVTPEKAEILRGYRLKTVEEVRDLTEGQLEKIQLPNMRDLRKAAAIFLDNRGAAESAAREAERDNELAAQSAQIAELNDRLAAAMDLLEARMAPGTDELESLRSQLRERGIEFHHKAGAATLRSLLAEATQKAA